MLKFHAVVSYISDEPSRNVRCRSSTSTDFFTSASNSKIAATNGASGWRLGTIRLPAGISRSLASSPNCVVAAVTVMGLSLV